MTKLVGIWRERILLHSKGRGRGSTALYATSGENVRSGQPGRAEGKKEGRKGRRKGRGGKEGIEGEGRGWGREATGEEERDTAPWNEPRPSAATPAPVLSLLSLAGWSTYSVSSPRHLVPHFILDLELLFLFSTVLPPSPPYPRYSTLRLDKNRSYHSQLTNLCRPRIPPQYLSATVTPGVRGQVRPACNWTLTPNIRQSRARPRWHCVDGAWSSEAVGQWALWLAARGPA